MSSAEAEEPPLKKQKLDDESYKATTTSSPEENVWILLQFHSSSYWCLLTLVEGFQWRVITNQPRPTNANWKRVRVQMPALQNCKSKIQMSCLHFGFVPYTTSVADLLQSDLQFGLLQRTQNKIQLHRKESKVWVCCCARHDGHYTGKGFSFSWRSHPETRCMFGWQHSQICFLPRPSILEWGEEGEEKDEEEGEEMKWRGHDKGAKTVSCSSFIPRQSNFS